MEFLVNQNGIQIICWRYSFNVWFVIFLLTVGQWNAGSQSSSCLTRSGCVESRRMGSHVRQGLSNSAMMGKQALSSVRVKNYKNLMHYIPSFIELCLCVLRIWILCLCAYMCVFECVFVCPRLFCWNLKWFLDIVMNFRIPHWCLTSKSYTRHERVCDTETSISMLLPSIPFPHRFAECE